MNTPVASLPPIDQRALRILFDTYWTAAGWRPREEYSTAPEDLAYAKRAGIMFDPAHVSHDDVVARALAAARLCDRQSVANAFVVSLPSRRLDLRSALGSFAALQHFARHEMRVADGGCAVCGAYDHPDRPEDLNVLNFERHKWGGVRHTYPLYAALDLELFSRLPRLQPTREDTRILQEVLRAIEGAPAGTSAATLERCLARTIRSNKAERDTLIGILGLCSVLRTPGHPGFLHSFVPESAQELPARRFVDMAYPACWWQSSDGLDNDAVEYWFGHLL